MAFSIMLTPYGRCVAGSTHFSATCVAISLRVLASSCSLSFSPTCISPFLRIYICVVSANHLKLAADPHTSLTMSLTSVVLKALRRSSALATSPFETFMKTLLIWRTSSISDSLKQAGQNNQLLSDSSHQETHTPFLHSCTLFL